MSDRPLTEREVLAMFAAIDKAADDKLERELLRERKHKRREFLLHERARELEQQS